MKKLINFSLDVLLASVIFEKDQQVFSKKVAIDLSDVNNPKVHFEDDEYDGEIEDNIKTYIELIGLVPMDTKTYYPAGLPTELWRN